MIPILLGVTLIIFLMLHMVPGDPAVVMLGNKATEENVARMHKTLGLDKPLPVQYGIYLKNLLQGDFGESYFHRSPARGIILERIPTTALLAVYATVLALLITVPISIIGAYKRNGIADHAVRVFLMVGLAMPGFWLGINLLLLLSVRFHVFPAGGYGDNFLEHLKHLFLPALTMAIAMSAILVRSLRTSLIETLSSDHVRTARAKGLRSSTIMFWHVLRNSSLSTMTILGVYMASLIGGSVIIEQIFAIPGLGQLMITSIFSRDYPVIQGITLVYGLIVIIVNLAVDLLYAQLDPRVRLE